jgi:two-component sensor histidine kinase
VPKRAHLSFLAALLPILLFSAIMVLVLDNHQRKALDRTIQEAARTVAASIDGEIIRNLTALETLAASSRLDTPAGVEELYHRCRSIMATHPDWINVLLSDGERPLFNMRFALGSRLPPLLDPEGNRAVIATALPRIGGVFRVRDRQPDPFVTFRVPVRASVGGPVTHVLSIGIRAWSFSEPLQLDEPGQGWRFALIDGDLRLIARSKSPDPGDDWIGTEAAKTLGDGIRNNLQVFPMVNRDGQRFVAGARRLRRAGWTVTAAAPFEMIAQSSRRNLALAAGSGAFALALAAWLGSSLISSMRRGHAAESRLIELNAERQSERRLDRIAGDFPGLILRRVLHPDGRLSFPYVSEGGRSLLNLDAEAAPAPETVERVAERIIAPEDRQAWIAALRHSARTLEPTIFEVRILTRDGRPTWVRTVARPTLLPDGSVVWDSVALDINDLKLTQAELELRLAEKDTLLREVHHRVKNNLQAIWGLIQVERSRMRDPAARDCLDAIGQRLSVIGAIHERFYASGNLRSIDCLRQLAELSEALAARRERPDIRVGVTGDPDLTLDLDTALAVGLMASELIDNCHRHAFPGDRPGTIRVSLTRRGGGVDLIVADDGVGMPANRATGIGTIIVEALAAQIEAAVSVETGTAGTTVTVSTA